MQVALRTRPTASKKQEFVLVLQKEQVVVLQLVQQILQGYHLVVAE